MATASTLQAITVNIGDDSLFPGTAEVIAATPAQSTFAQGTNGTLAQTFSVDTPFSLNSIFLSYQVDSGASGDQTLLMTIFQVADVSAATLTDTPLPEDILLTGMVTFPYMESDTIAQIGLDSPLSLSESVGASGYAVHFSNIESPGWEWHRTTNGTGGSVYAGGKMYQDGVEKTSGNRELALALSSVAPPVPPEDTFSVLSGDLLAASTWDNNLAPIGAEPSPNYIHNIIDGHNVSASGSQSYNGVQINVVDGTLTYTASTIDLPSIVVSEGATVTETTTGEFFLGDINSANGLGSMELNGTLEINAEGGADAALDMAMSGTGTANVTVESGGRVFLTDMSQFDGVLQFNGSGDEVLYEGPPDSDMRLEMNSTGINRLAWNTSANGAVTSNLVYNQPGEFDHQTTDQTGPRLASVNELTANANVSVDLTKTYAGNERRLFMNAGLSGAGTITVNGTLTDPTDMPNDIGLNEFETGVTNERRSDTNSFTGTVVANDFVNLEIRQHLSGGAIQVNQSAVLDVGHDEVANYFSTRIGEVTIGSGGTLEVGYADLASGTEEHVPFDLRLTTQRGRSGDLTLASGSATVMQISGTDANQFDTISAEGTVTLSGELRVLIDPALTSGTTHATQGTYVPTDGDTFEIISVAPELLPGDYDASGTVDNADYELWKETFGDEFDVSADGNLDGVVNLADYTVWRNNLGATGSVSGAIVGDFSSMVIDDPGNVLAGFTVTKTVTTGVGGNVTLTINADSGALGATSVPEPSSLLLAGLSVMAAFGLVGRRRRVPAYPMV